MLGRSPPRPRPSLPGAPGEVTDRDCWGTPDWLFEQLNAEFNFTVDVAANANNYKLPRWYGPGSTVSDGLAVRWSGERWFCNPPFSRIPFWVEHGWNSFWPAAPAEVGVMLLPSNRTEQRWWHRYVEPYRDGRATALGLGVRLETRFIETRVDYVPPPGIAASTPAFGSLILIWKPEPRT